MLKVVSHALLSTLCSREVHPYPTVGAHGYFEVTNAEFAKNYTMMYVSWPIHTDSIAQLLIRCLQGCIKRGMPMRNTCHERIEVYLYSTSFYQNGRRTPITGMTPAGNHAR